MVTANCGRGARRRALGRCLRRWYVRLFSLLQGIPGCPHGGSRSSSDLDHVVCRFHRLQLCGALTAVASTDECRCRGMADRSASSRLSRMSPVRFCSPRDDRSDSDNPVPAVWSPVSGTSPVALPISMDDLTKRPASMLDHSTTVSRKFAGRAISPRDTSRCCEQSERAS